MYYLLLYNKFLPNIATENKKYLLFHNFCGPGIWEQFSWRAKMSLEGLALWRAKLRVSRKRHVSRRGWRAFVLHQLCPESFGFPDDFGGLATLNPAKGTRAHTPLPRPQREPSAEASGALLGRNVLVFLCNEIKCMCRRSVFYKLSSLVVMRLKQFSPSVNASLQIRWKHIIRQPICAF